MDEGRVVRRVGILVFNFRHMREFCRGISIVSLVLHDTIEVRHMDQLLF